MAMSNEPLDVGWWN